MTKPQDDTPSLAESALRLFDERRKRDVIFNEPDLFREPAWDILLLLYAQSSGADIGDRSLRSFVGLNPIFYWMKALQAQNLVDVDPLYGSKKLTEHGKDTMAAYLAGLER